MTISSCVNHPIAGTKYLTPISCIRRSLFCLMILEDLVYDWLDPRQEHYSTIKAPDFMAARKQNKEETAEKIITPKAY